MSDSGNNGEEKGTSRREFLAHSAMATTMVGLSIARTAHVAGSDELKIALIGCGGRGSGAVDDALHCSAPMRIVALADVLGDRVQRSLKALHEVEEIQGKIDIPEERQFVGFEAYKRVLDLNVDIVLLTTPPAFRPLQYSDAVQAGKHVFMEKPCCVDGPGYRRMMEANRVADSKGLKVVVGLQRRHQKSYLEGIKRIHDGEVGDIVLIRTYFNMPGGGPDYRRRPATVTEMEWQLRRWGRYTWLSGDHIVEQAVHEIDIANWIKGDETPVKANGMGGRQVRIGCGNGQIFDHHFVEYTYADGARHYAQAKQQPGGWTHVSDNVHGTEGVFTVGSGPYGMGGKSEYAGGEKRTLEQEMESPYRREHQDLVDAILNNTQLNDGYHGTNSSMTAVLGRMATYSGQEVTWDEAVKSDLELAPGLEDYTLSTTPPVVPDSEGNYPIAKPGFTKAL
jgi:predicted dehydrogenase